MKNSGTEGIIILFLFECRLFGDYESLEAGKARDAMVDMMGGVGQGVDLQEFV